MNTDAEVCGGNGEAEKDGDGDGVSGDGGRASSCIALETSSRSTNVGVYVGVCYFLGWC